MRRKSLCHASAMRAPCSYLWITYSLSIHLNKISARREPGMQSFSCGLRREREAGCSAACTDCVGEFSTTKKVHRLYWQKWWANLEGERCTFQNVNQPRRPHTPLLLRKLCRSPFNRRAIINGALLMLKSHSCVSLLRVKTLNTSPPCGRLHTVTLHVRDGPALYGAKWKYMTFFLAFNRIFFGLFITFTTFHFAQIMNY